MKTLLRTHDTKYEDSDLLKLPRWLGYSYGLILDADGHSRKIFVQDN